MFCFVILSCNSFYPVIPVTQYILQRQFYTQYFTQGAVYRIQNTGAVYKIPQGTLKNVTCSYAGGLQNTTNRVGLKNTTSTATCLRIVGSVAMVLESVYVEVRLCVLPLVQTLSDGNNPNFVSLK